VASQVKLCSPGKIRQGTCRGVPDKATLWHSEITHLCCGRADGARNTAQGLALVGMARDLLPADLKAVRTAIGTELRKLSSDLSHEEIPDRMAELIKQLDQLTEANPRGRDADDR
jgi:hypothetical protein